MNRTETDMEIPPEFKHLLGLSTLSWDSITSAANRFVSVGPETGSTAQARQAADCQAEELFGEGSPPED